jgi:hypothetical protein
VFDGELVVLEDAGRPLINERLFGRGRSTYVAFDLLVAAGVDLRPLPLRERKAALARFGERAEGWIALTDGVVGEGRALYRAVVDADLEGIVAKRLADVRGCAFRHAGALARVAWDDPRLLEAMGRLQIWSRPGALWLGVHSVLPLTINTDDGSESRCEA